MKYLSGDPGKEGQVLSNSVENTSLDCADFRGRSREGTKKRALENEEQKTKKSPRRNLGRRSPSICREKKAEAFRNFPAKKGSKTGP